MRERWWCSNGSEGVQRGRPGGSGRSDFEKEGGAEKGLLEKKARAKGNL